MDRKQNIGRYLLAGFLILVLIAAGSAFGYQAGVAKGVTASDAWLESGFTNGLTHTDEFSGHMSGYRGRSSMFGLFTFGFFALLFKFVFFIIMIKIIFRLLFGRRHGWGMHEHMPRHMPRKMRRKMYRRWKHMYDDEDFWDEDDSEELKEDKKESPDNDE